MSAVPVLSHFHFPVNRYRERLAKSNGSIYALPRKLIDLIHEETDVFSVEDLQFERELARYAPGFVMKRQLNCPFLPGWQTTDSRLQPILKHLWVDGFPRTCQRLISSLGLTLGDRFRP